MMAWDLIPLLTNLTYGPHVEKTIAVDQSKTLETLCHTGPPQTRLSIDGFFKSCCCRDKDREDEVVV